jgi:capsular polysaccharide transport system ATP-binding protein
MHQVLNSSSSAEPILAFDKFVLRADKSDSSVVISSPWNWWINSGDRLSVMTTNSFLSYQLMATLAGLVKPVSGEVLKQGTVSWPLGGEGGLDGKLSIDQSLEFLINIYSDCLEKSRVTLQEFYEALQAQSIQSSLKLKELEKDQKDYFYMALSILFSFDVYLVPKFRYLMSRRAMPLRELLHRQLEGNSLISTGGNNRFRREFCNKGLVLDRFGEVIFQGDLEQAIAMIDQKNADSGSVDSEDDQFNFGDGLKNSDQDELNDVL